MRRVDDVVVKVDDIEKALDERVWEREIMMQE
jgi:hypothetical protein